MDGVKVKIPTVFIAGEKDVVIRGAGAEQLRTMMSTATEDLRDVHLSAGAGHWVQQEHPEMVNGWLVEFLAGLD